MTTEQFAMWYFIIGLTYCAINGFIRKIDTQGDFLLPLVWFLIWPIGILSLTVMASINGYKKLFNKN